MSVTEGIFSVGKAPPKKSPHLVSPVFTPSSPIKMRRRHNILATPLHLRSVQSSHSSQAMFFKYMQEMQSNLRMSLLTDPKTHLGDVTRKNRDVFGDLEDQFHASVMERNNASRMSIKSLHQLKDEPHGHIAYLTHIWYQAIDDYLAPYLNKHKPQFLEKELEGMEFGMKQLNGYSKRYELYAPRVQLDFSLMAYTTRYQPFLDGMPLTKPIFEDVVYTVQKWERDIMKQFDRLMLKTQQHSSNGRRALGGTAVAPTVEERQRRHLGSSMTPSAHEEEEQQTGAPNSTLVDKLLHRKIRDYTLEQMEKDQKGPILEYTDQFHGNYLNNLMRYITVDYYHGDVFSKHHLRWRMDAFDRIGKYTQQLEKDDQDLITESHAGKTTPIGTQSEKSDW